MTHQITIDVTDEEMAVLSECEDLLGVSPEEFAREALGGGIERGREFLASGEAEILRRDA